MAPSATQTDQVVHVSRTRFGHLDLNCPVLEADRPAGIRQESMVVPAEAATLVSFFDPRGVPLNAVVLACRVCALEQVVVELLTAPRDPDEVRVLAVSALRPHGEWLYSSVADAEASTARRVALAAGLSIAEHAGGPVMYGFLPNSVAQALTRLVSCDVHFGVRDLPDRRTVTAYWDLAQNAPSHRIAMWPIANDLCA